LLRQAALDVDRTGSEKEAMAKIKTTKKDDLQDSLVIPDGSLIDLTNFDWGKQHLTDKQKLFVAWFCTPGTDTYHCITRAARKAGYMESTAHDVGYKMRQNPKIDALIKKFEAKIGKYNLIDAAQRWIHEKIIRGDYDVNDFYEADTNGQLRLKPPNRLTKEQRLCIDGLDVKGQKGIMVYTFPDREKIRDSLIAYVKKDETGKDGDGYDVETLTQIIKGEVKVKTRIINRNKELLAKADGFRTPPRELVEEE
jgi:hypothetical protein